MATHQVNAALKMALFAKGLSQRQVAADCNIAESRFSTIARGWIEPTDDERKRIAAYLGKSTKDLFPLRKPAPAD